MGLFDNFTNQYQLSKTLRFELVPVGETLSLLKNDENGESQNLLEYLLHEDNILQKEYTVVKKLIDEYHKEFIDKSLNGFYLDKNKIEDFENLFRKESKDDNEKKQFNVIKAELRKAVAKKFKDQSGYSDLDKLELLKEKTKDGKTDGNIIPKWLEEKNSDGKTKFDLLFENTPAGKTSVLKKVIQNEFKEFNELKTDDELKNKLKESLKKFQEGFFTYLKPFCENRKENIYTAEFKSTAISKRLIDDNLPKFLFNKKVYETQTHKSFFDGVEQKLKEQLKDKITFNSLEDWFCIFNKTLIQKGIDDYNLLIGGRKPENNQSQIKGLNNLIKEEYNDKLKDKNDKRIPKLKKLFKLPLCDSASASFTYEPFANDKTALLAIKEFYEKILKQDADGNVVDILEGIKNLLSGLKSYDLNKIYIKRGMLETISTRIFNAQGIDNDWNIINMALEEYFADGNIPESPEAELNKIR